MVLLQQSQYRYAGIPLEIRPRVFERSTSGSYSSQSHKDSSSVEVRHHNRSFSGPKVPILATDEPMFITYRIQSEANVKTMYMNFEAEYLRRTLYALA